MKLELIHLLVICLFVVLVVGLVMYVVIRRLFQQLEKKEMEAIEMMIDAQEKERGIIAREVHDNLGPTLSIARMQLGFLMENPENPNSELILGNIQHQLHEAIHLCRDLSHMLSPVLTQDRNLYTVLQQQVAMINELGTMDVSFSAEHEICWDLKKGTSVVRVIQELLNNTLKHARAKRVRIVINEQMPNVTINYSDDGIGFSVAQHHSGIGIQNILKRVSILGGQAHWFSSPDSLGTNVKITIPMKNIISDDADINSR